MKNNYDLIIIGGGIMGLMTAYYASATSQKILILEKDKLFNKQAASNGLTRSMRQDYLDPFYSSLAYDSRQLWLRLQKQAREKILIECGCLNLAIDKFTPDLKRSYAFQAKQNLENLGVTVKEYDEKQLKTAFPQFVADYASLNIEGGFIYVPPLKKFLLNFLREREVEIIENVAVSSISSVQGKYNVQVDGERYQASKLVLTPGRWVNEVLQKVNGNKLQFPIYLAKPKECRYFFPSESEIGNFTQPKLPVFACLDIGIYGHPIYQGKTPAVKIGFFEPDDWKSKYKIKSIAQFIDSYLPGLKNARSEPVLDYDQCYYTMVRDDEFILGELPGFPGIYVGSGWRGTGFKFAPLIGKVLSDLVSSKKLQYAIERFNPARFTKS